MQFLGKSRRWQDTINADFCTSTKRLRGKFFFFHRSFTIKEAKTQFVTLKIDTESDFTLIGTHYISVIITVYMVITVTNEQCVPIWHVQVQPTKFLCELLYCLLLIINSARFSTENIVLNKHCYREKSHWCKSSNKGPLNEKSNLYISKLITPLHYFMVKGEQCPPPLITESGKCNMFDGLYNAGWVSDDMVHPFHLTQNEFQTGIFDGSSKAISNDGMGSAARHISIFLVHKRTPKPFLIMYAISTHTHTHTHTKIHTHT